MTTQNCIRHSVDTLFEGIIQTDLSSPPSNVVYILDISGSMYLGHDLIRKHLVDHLINRADLEKMRRVNHLQHNIHSYNCSTGKIPSPFVPSKFNIVAFSDNVQPWSDNLVTLTRENVSVCAQWVKQNLKVKSGPSLILPSLLFALNNSQVDEVVLITDSLPCDRGLDSTLARISVASKGRPVHAILVQPPKPVTENYSSQLPDSDQKACEAFLKSLTKVTGSLMRKVQVDVTGRRFDDVTLVRENRYDQENTQKTGPISETLSKQLDGMSLMFPMSNCCFTCHRVDCCCPVVPTWRTLKSKPLKMPDVPSLDAASLLIGRAVLARRNKDGFHYLGVVSERSLDVSRFFVEFPDGKNEKTQIEEISLKDIVNFEDGLRNAIHEGDKVLAALKGSRRLCFAPGTVIEGQDLKLSFADPVQLGIAFSVGDSKSVSSDLVVRIPESLFEKLSLEHGASPNERRSLQLARDQIDCEKQEGGPICRGYPMQPSLCHGASCCCCNIRYLPVCRGETSGSHRCDNTTSCCMSMTPNNQDILITNVKDSFVHAEDLNVKDLLPRGENYPQPFRREGKNGWSLYQEGELGCCHGDDNHFCCHCESHKVKQHCDSDEDFDEFLTDVRAWGDTKDAATSTDIALMCPPWKEKMSQKPPWRYWKRHRYENSPRSQPPYFGDPADYPVVRPFSIQDTSGLSGSHRQQLNYSLLSNNFGTEHISENQKPNFDEQPLDQPDKYQGSSEDSAAGLTGDQVSKESENHVQFVESGPPDTKFEHEGESQKQVVSNFDSDVTQHRRQIGYHARSEQDLMRNHVEKHWAFETNRYFDEIRDNLRKQSYMKGRNWMNKAARETQLDLECLGSFQPPMTNLTEYKDKYIWENS